MTRDDNHTPGPWHIAGGLSGSSSSIEIYSALELWVGSAQGCHDTTADCGCVKKAPGFPTDEEAVANACLIKEAPMLLEALRTILTMIPPEGFVIPDGSNRLANVAAVASHAIGLATDKLIREVEKK